MQQSKYTGSQRHGMLHDRMKQGDKDKSDPDAIESMRRIKNLKLKKDSLIRSVEDRSEEIERKVIICDHFTVSENIDVFNE